MNYPIIQNLFGIRRVENGILEVDTMNKYYKIKNFFLPLIAFAILRIYKAPSYIIFLIVFGVYLYVTHRHIELYNNKIDFLNDILFNNEIEPYNINSFLELDERLVDFYYNHKDYIDYNLTAYRKSLENTNGLLQITYLLRNITENPDQLYQNAKIYFQDALNNWQSLIHTIPPNIAADNKFNDSLTNLRELLFFHLRNMVQTLQDNYQRYNINIYSVLNPLQLMSDLNDREYSPNFSFF